MTCLRSETGLPPLLSSGDNGQLKSPAIIFFDLKTLAAFVELI